MAQNGVGLASLAGLRGGDTERARWASDLQSLAEGRNEIQGSGSCWSIGREVAETRAVGSGQQRQGQVMARLEGDFALCVSALGSAMGKNCW